MEAQHARITRLCEQLKLLSISDQYAHLAQESIEKDSSFVDLLEKVLLAE